MSNSPLLALPYLAASQAQKHVTLNEALSILDGLLHLAVITRSLATPPTAPADGDRYLIAASPTAAWAGHAGKIALRMAGAWRFLTPQTGWRIWISNETVLLVYNGTAWIAPPAPSSLQNLSLLGVNATADTTNKFAVSSSAVLFNNAGAGIQFKINKVAAADTASLLFQTGFSGRAEIGITGDDDLHFKVSATGSSFKESLIVAAGSGLVTFRNTLALDPQPADPTTPSNGQLWYNSTAGKFRGHQNGASLDIVAAATALADGDKGDITVSGSGAVWAIDPGTVTNAKLGNVNTATFKARTTAGSGSPEDLTGTQATTLLDVATASLKGLMSSADFTKLSGIATGATANSSDAILLARATHTGTQAAATISDFTEAAQDAVGAAFDTTLVYNDAGNSMGRAALSGHITIAAASNVAALGSFTLAQLNTAVSDADVSPTTHTHVLAAGATDVSITAANLNILDDGVDTTLHFHAADRARANHTGTQLLGTISDVSITAANLNILDDGIDTTLHFHAADRARANHTGTQLLGTISDVTMTVANFNILDDGVDTTLHFHAADRARANHTGTQSSSTITGLGTLATQSGTFSGTASGTNTGDQLTFATIAVSGQSDVVADVAADTLTLVAGSNVTITTNAGSDTITINSTASGGGVSDGDKGDITVSGSGAVWTIDANTISNAKLTQMPALTFKANATAATADAQNLTIEQSLVALNIQGLICARNLISA